MSYYLEKKENEEFLKRVVDIIDGCGTGLIKMTDDDIDYQLWDNGCIDDAIFCLKKGYLEDLKDNWLISEEVFEKCFLLGEKIRELNCTEKWSVESIRSDKAWQDIMALADEIKPLIPDFAQIKEPKEMKLEKRHYTFLKREFNITDIDNLNSKKYFTLHNELQEMAFSLRKERDMRMDTARDILYYVRRKYDLFSEERGIIIVADDD